MDIVERLKTTLKALDDAGVPAALKPVAFVKVFDSFGATAQPKNDGSSEYSSGGGGSEGIGRIAARLGLGQEVVERAFVLDGDALEIVIPAARFDAAKSRASEQVALLVAAARQAGGLDDDGWTSVDHIRVACEHFKRYDPGNFATTIKGMDNVFSVRGSGRDRKVRMTAPAWQRASELLVQLVGAAN